MASPQREVLRVEEGRLVRHAVQLVTERTATLAAMDAAVDRIRASAVDGATLERAISKAIAKAHGGDIEIDCPVRLLHGMQDPDVPEALMHAIKLGLELDPGDVTFFLGTTAVGILGGSAGLAGAIAGLQRAPA